MNNRPQQAHSFHEENSLSDEMADVLRQKTESERLEIGFEMWRAPDLPSSDRLITTNLLLEWSQHFTKTTVGESHEWSTSKYHKVIALLSMSAIALGTSAFYRWEIIEGAFSRVPQSAA
ncbi:MAG: hypothetical protein P8M30_08545 [Planctomycetaceae bacterium]|nr:hypothetical protein [Planctomycetaceae bacterium]